MEKKELVIFYTSDLHFCDEKIRQVCSRPFESVEAMNKAIIQKWNNKVDKTDMVYILGDIFPCDGGDAQVITDLVKKLNGSKILIVGNHDEKYLSKIEGSEVFNKIKHLLIMHDSNKEITLCHYPLMSWQNDDCGSIHLYGHIHNKDLHLIKSYYTDKKAFNVGLDVRNLEPVSLSEILGGTI